MDARNLPDWRHSQGVIVRLRCLRYALVVNQNLSVLSFTRAVRCPLAMLDCESMFGNPKFSLVCLFKIFQFMQFLNLFVKCLNKIVGFLNNVELVAVSYVRRCTSLRLLSLLP